MDESKDPSYLLVAALIRPAHITSIRRAVNAMVLPHQRRIHFCKEHDGRRSQIMNRLAELPVEAIVYQAASNSSKSAVRDRCLTALVRDHLERDVRRLTIERDDSHVDSDRRILRDEVRRFGATEELWYEHLRAFEEPLLCVADAIAWCWPRGGSWRTKAKPLVTEVHVV